MVKKEQSPPKLISIPKGGMYHTFIVPDKEPWYIELLANVVFVGTIIAFCSYTLYLVSVSY